MISHSPRAFHLIAAVAAMLFAFACAAPPEASSPASAEHDPSNSTAPRSQALSCPDQCYWAGQSCPSECGASVDECAAATQLCYRSCDSGNGPWLPC